MGKGGLEYPRTIAKSMNTLIPLILSLSKDGLTGA